MFVSGGIKSFPIYYEVFSMFFMKNSIKIVIKPKIKSVYIQKEGTFLKKTGMIRRMDELGRIVLPKEMRRSLDLVTNTNVEMFVRDGNIHIRKQERTCFVTGEITENQLELYDGRLILSQEGAQDLLTTLQKWI